MSLRFESLWGNDMCNSLEEAVATTEGVGIDLQNKVILGKLGQLYRYRVGITIHSYRHTHHG